MNYTPVRGESFQVGWRKERRAELMPSGLAIEIEFDGFLRATCLDSGTPADRAL